MAGSSSRTHTFAENPTLHVQMASNIEKKIHKGSMGHQTGLAKGPLAAEWEHPLPLLSFLPTAGTGFGLLGVLLGRDCVFVLGWAECAWLVGSTPFTSHSPIPHRSWGEWCRLWVYKRRDVLSLPLSLHPSPWEVRKLPPLFSAVFNINVYMLVFGV